MVTIREAQPIIDLYVMQAAALIEQMTGTAEDPEWIYNQLADSEWIFGGCTDDGEDGIDIDEALLQLSYIVDREIEFIKSEEAEQ